MLELKLILAAVLYLGFILTGTLLMIGLIIWLGGIYDDIFNRAYSSYYDEVLQKNRFSGENVGTDLLIADVDYILARARSAHDYHKPQENGDAQ